MSFVVQEAEFNGEDFDVKLVEADETNFGEVVYAIEENSLENSSFE